MAGAIRRVCLAPWQFSCWNEGDLQLYAALHASLTTRGYVLSLRAMH